MHRTARACSTGSALPLIPATLPLVSATRALTLVASPRSPTRSTGRRTAWAAIKDRTATLHTTRSGGCGGGAALTILHP
jgi:hypothetical protein